MTEPAFVDELQHLGRQMFGKPSRLRLGVWIASLPGHGERTFCQVEYVDFIESKNWQFGQERISIAADLKRFVACDMLRERTDIKQPAPLKKDGQSYNTRPRRARWWTRMESPLWDIFLVAGVVLGEHIDHTAAQRRRVIHELLALREALRESVPRTGSIL